MLPELLIKNSQAQLLRSLIVRDGTFTVGREPGCSVVLPSPDISRHHAAFTHSPLYGVLSVEDQHSKNGVFVNGRQMRRSVLYAGDVVRIGNYCIHVRTGSSGPPGLEAAATRSAKAQRKAPTPPVPAPASAAAPDAATAAADDAIVATD